MTYLILGLSCLIVGFLLGALVITHPAAALRAITPPSGDVDKLKAQVADLEAKLAAKV